ncbi:hypothetical protein D3C76_1502130 [compost metagenome]
MQAQRPFAGPQKQRPGIVGHLQRQFTFKQLYPALLPVEAHVGGTAGVKLQHAAIFQAHAPALPHRAAVVGHQSGQRVVLLQPQAGGTGHSHQQQCLERAPPGG